MSRLALATRVFSSDTTAADAGAAFERWGVRAAMLDVPGPVRVSSRRDARSAGLEVVAVAHRLEPGEPGASAEDADAFLRSLGAAMRVAASTRAPALVVEGGGLGTATDRAIVGAGDDAQAIRALRDAAREAATERAARALHTALASGASLFVRNGGRDTELLGFEETGWLLDALPRLGLFLDPARAHLFARAGHGPPVEAWVERFASRVGGVVLHSVGPNTADWLLDGEDAVDWPSVLEGLPRSALRVLDLEPWFTGADVAEEVRYARLLSDTSGPAGP